MTFIPHTPQEREAMLAAIGLSSLEDLFVDVPEQFRLPSLNMPNGVSELEVQAHMRTLARANQPPEALFLGGGFYDHAIPAAVDSLSGRGEFFTAYTPYQPEASRGTLQAIFEFQSMVCRLTGMDAANASIYDGGTSLAEAALLALGATRRKKLVVDGGVNPLYIRQLETYVKNLDVTLIKLPPVASGPADRTALEAVIGDDVAAVLVQNPNFFGAVDDFTDLAEKVHAAGALLICSFYPVAMGAIKRPGDMGVDIATGEGQSLGLPLSYGGPYLGLFAVRKALIRRMPGRVVGETVDQQGRRAYVLTLQAREQHIRRERATSNICTNQALCALRATIHMSMLGRHGLRALAHTCIRKADYARKRLASVDGVEIISQGAVFNEFVIQLPTPATAVYEKLLQHGVVAGLPLARFYPQFDRMMLVALTEKRTAQEIETFVNALEDVL